MYMNIRQKCLAQYLTLFVIQLGTLYRGDFPNKLNHNVPGILFCHFT